MKRINANTVEFESDLEGDAAEFFDVILENGVSIIRAVEMVRSCERFNSLDEDFWTYLRDGVK